MIDGSTGITLGAAVAVCGAVAGAVWKFSSIVAGLKDSNTENVDALARVVDKLLSRMDQLEKSNTSKLGLEAASEHALRFAIENPGLRVPDPRDHNRIFVVDSARVFMAGAEPNGG